MAIPEQLKFSPFAVCRVGCIAFPVSVATAIWSPSAAPEFLSAHPEMLLARSQSWGDLGINVAAHELHFLHAGEMPNQSTGLFSPDADTDRQHLRGFEWGLEQYSETGPRGLRRFDCSLRAADATPRSTH